MAEILLLAIACPPHVPDADSSAQVSVELFFHSFGVPPGKGGTEGVQPRCVLPDFCLKPFLNLFLEDLSDLPVWDGQTVYIRVLCPPLGQVARGKKYTPQIIDTAYSSL